MKLTNFRFFKNTPLIDFQNTIHFSSNAERDTFFLEGGHYSELEVEGLKFNFIRDRSTISIPIDYNELKGINYCTFKSDFESTRFYAYVANYEYINDGNTKIYLLIDPIMTYTQGNVLEGLTNLTIQRQHLTPSLYSGYLWELKNNDDVLKTTTKNYFAGDRLLFDDLMVVISSSADLQADFGTVDDPKIKTSNGKVYDKVTSPLNLYGIAIERFNELMKEISPYPWISQNIKSMTLIPKMFIEENLTVLNFASTETLSGVNYLYGITGMNTRTGLLQEKLDTLSYSITELYTLFGLDPIQDKHLLRSEYTTSELYNYSGGQLFINNGQLNPVKGLDLQADIITGYFNQLMVYIDGYKVAGGLYQSNAGSYANDSLVINQFDDIPMLIDNYTLSLSKSANQRQLAESKLVSNRVKNITNPNASLKDRFMDATSLISNVSASGLFGKFTDEYEFYRTQKAEQADLALETPTITAQSNSNSFNIANNMFGIHLKFSKPVKSELGKVKKYYKMFGFQIDDSSNRLADVESMSICNYVQFSGSWTIGNTDVALIEMMKAQFENGVRLWHNNGTANPMDQNTLLNKMR